MVKPCCTSSCDRPVLRTHPLNSSNFLALSRTRSQRLQFGIEPRRSFAVPGDPGQRADLRFRILFLNAVFSSAFRRERRHPHRRPPSFPQPVCRPACRTAGASAPAAASAPRDWSSARSPRPRTKGKRPAQHPSVERRRRARGVRRSNRFGGGFSCHRVVIVLCAVYHPSQKFGRR